MVVTEGLEVGDTSLLARQPNNSANLNLTKSQTHGIFTNHVVLQMVNYIIPVVQLGQ